MFVNKVAAASVLAAGVASALPQGSVPEMPNLPVESPSVPTPTPIFTPFPTPTPTPGAGTPNYAFEIVALRSASEIHFAKVSAAESNLWLGLQDQGASCDAESDGSATFQIVDGELHLYSNENPPQRVYADRSGMGQGKVGYVTGAQSPPRNAETTGWTIDETGNLAFDGAGLLACPGYDNGAWAVWVSAGTANPGGHTDCLGFSARTVERKTPNSCLYTQS